MEKISIPWKTIKDTWKGSLLKKINTGRVGSMVAPRVFPPAGAFLSGQAVFHGRELLAELPLFTMNFG